MSLTILRRLDDLRAAVAGFRRAGERLAVVPTMGALHDGHLTLVREGRARTGRVMATIFVNPKQFGANEDLARYPRDEAGDCAKLAAAGADIAFIPAPDEIYPPGFSTRVLPGGPALAGLEDAFRPAFFEGVSTVVTKLLCMCGADMALFGEKDWQQLQVVKQISRDLALPTEIIGFPTIREEDGLAMSSRNAYLSPGQRAGAPAMHDALTKACRRIREGADPDQAAQLAAQWLEEHGWRVDYVAAREADSLGPVTAGKPVRLLAAAWLGSTRLIDNIGV